MSSPFVGEIQMFGFNFSPRGFASCNGALMAISQNTALFSLLGTYYGGDGRSTFALPNFQGRATSSSGQGPGLSFRDHGEVLGSYSVTLLTSEIPAHNHGVNAFSQTVAGTGTGTPVNNGGLSFLASSTTSKTFINAPLNTTLGINMVAVSGSSLPHSNQQPYLALNFCIALQGAFPPRS